MEIKELIKGVKSSNLRAIAKSITLLESKRAEDRLRVFELCDHLISNMQASKRLGISGAPGVGKSSFIEAFGLHLLEKYKDMKIGVLAVDPSSPITGGSILGDKTRMPQLAAHPRTFIRPSPSQGEIGGITRRTKEAILVLESAGYNIILIETVGVGQSEYAVADMVDAFLFLQQPGSGDGLQGIKKGILELADLIVINKADGELKPLAEDSKTNLAHSFSFLNRFKNINERILTCSAKENTGLSEIWLTIQSIYNERIASNQMEERRNQQLSCWFDKELSYLFFDYIHSDSHITNAYQEHLKLVLSKTISPPSAAFQLFSQKISSH